MEKVVEGFFRNGEIFLPEKINFKYARVKVIFHEESIQSNEKFLLRDKLKVRTKGFKFNRDEVYAH